MSKAAAALAILALSFVSEAEAQRFVQAGFLLGYAAEPEYRLGLGAKFDGAMPLSSPVLGAEGYHIAARGVFHFGSTQTVVIESIEGEVDTRVAYFSAELGLVWLLRDAMVRPFGMLGAAAIITDGSSQAGDFVLAGSSTQWELLVAPGLMVNIPFNRFMLTAEVEYFFVEELDSFAFYVTIGTLLR